MNFVWLLDLSTVACYRIDMGLFDFLRSSSDAGAAKSVAVEETDGETGPEDAAKHPSRPTTGSRGDGAVEPAVPSIPEGTPETPRGIHALEYDQANDQHVVVESYTTADDGPVGPGHLALSDIGRRFTDTWLREELGDLLEGDDPELAAELEAAYLSNDLKRRLVVTRTRPGTLRVDDAIEGPDLAIDDVDVNSPGGGG